MTFLRGAAILFFVIGMVYFIILGTHKLIADHINTPLTPEDIQNNFGSQYHFHVEPGQVFKIYDTEITVPMNVHEMTITLVPSGGAGKP